MRQSPQKTHRCGAIPPGSGCELYTPWMWVGVTSYQLGGPNLFCRVRRLFLQGCKRSTFKVFQFVWYSILVCYTKWQNWYRKRTKYVAVSACRNFNSVSLVKIISFFLSKVLFQSVKQLHEQICYGVGLGVKWLQWTFIAQSTDHFRINLYSTNMETLRQMGNMQSVRSFCDVHMWYWNNIFTSMPCQNSSNH